MQTAVSQIPAPEQQVSFHDMPSVLHQNESLKEKAITAIDARLQELQGIDIEKLDILRGDQIDADLNDLQVRGTDSVTLNKQRRTVYTKEFDRIRSLFTQSENEIQQRVDNIKDWRAKWNAEKYRRDQEEKKKQQAELDRKQAELDFANSVVKAINHHYIAEKANMIDRINESFYGRSIPDLQGEEYPLTLRDYQPQMPDFEFQKLISIHPLLKPDEMDAIVLKTKNEQFPILAKDYYDSVRAECQRLLTLIPSRISELERIASDEKAAAAAKQRQEDEQKKRNEALQKQREEINEAADATASVGKMDAAFDSVAAAPTIALSKGTTQKQKYNVSSHKAFIAIIQWWVSNNMALLTVEELQKKLSFMITAANKALNDKEPKIIESEGLTVEDDFTTRGSRK